MTKLELVLGLFEQRLAIDENKHMNINNEYADLMAAYKELEELQEKAAMYDGVSE